LGGVVSSALFTSSKGLQNPEAAPSLSSAGMDRANGSSKDR
jgi:hypothetical protein